LFYFLSHPQEIITGVEFLAGKPAALYELTSPLLPIFIDIHLSISNGSHEFYESTVVGPNSSSVYHAKESIAVIATPGTVFLNIL